MLPSRCSSVRAAGRLGQFLRAVQLRPVTYSTARDGVRGNPADGENYWHRAADRGVLRHVRVDLAQGVIIGLPCPTSFSNLPPTR